MDSTVYNDKYNKQREELLKKKDIVKEGDKYILKVNLEFKSPSGASIFVFGGSINGWLDWKNDKGVTIDKLYRKKSK